MSKTKIIVDNIQKILREKTQKIQARIKELDQELESVGASIKVLTNQLVQCEINGDSEGQDTLNKKISELKQRQHSLQDKIEPYQNALKDTSFINAELPKLFAAARADQKLRIGTIENKQEKLAELQQALARTQEEINVLLNVTGALQGRIEAKEIRPLLKYIETRQIKYGHEEAYIDARIGGITGELLEQNFELEPEPQGGPTNLLIRTVEHGPYRPLPTTI